MLSCDVSPLPSPLEQVRASWMGLRMFGYGEVQLYLSALHAFAH
jgi:hypothetical protein